MTRIVLFSNKHFCKRCNELKPLTKEFFYLKKDGRFSDCKICAKIREDKKLRRTRQRELYKINRISKIRYNLKYKTNERDKEYYAKISTGVTDAYAVKILQKRLGISAKIIREQYSELIPTYKLQLGIKRKFKLGK